MARDRREYFKKYHTENKEREKEYRKQNKDRLASNSKKHYEEHKEYIKATVTAYRKTGAGKLTRKKEYQKYKQSPHYKELKKRTAITYYQTPKGKANRISVTNTRRARKLNQLGPNPPSSEQILDLLSKPCKYCGNPSEHIDHIVPLSRGGLHDMSNVIGSCAPCNMAKGNKLVSEWLASLGEPNGREASPDDQIDRDPNDSLS